MWYSFDRQEGEIAVLVNDQGDSIEVPISSLPPHTKVGARLRQSDAGFVLDQEETVRRRQYVLDLQARLRSKNKPS
ncbi:MAG: DUF3006 domain-containing protein [Clostridia bacterium]|nr:DUF3006 domain-containing protein [Loktanella sp.]MBQ1950758.1 DUF3006 domain-containing protein [Clostridia bacterium]